ncbi:hypothetical protein BDW_10785 [Bdellovibrio bacteriovorus W]|nr:hypothetical protein BDW_10785 [Bdellovibrio bacteriovorus W]
MKKNKRKFIPKLSIDKNDLLKAWRITQKTAICIFIGVNLAIMYIDGLPDKTPLGKNFTDLPIVARYQAFAMIYQPWSMFAPNPMNSNAFLQAEVLFKDGSKRIWDFPRQNLMSGARRVLVGDRYRLYGQESLKPGSVELMWQDVSKYITRQVLIDEEAQSTFREVEKITFFRFSNTITPPPAAPFIPHGQLSQNYQIDPVFYYIPTVSQVNYDYKNNN